MSATRKLSYFQDAAGLSALHLASYLGSFDVAMALLDHVISYGFNLTWQGAEPFIRAPNGLTPLDIAMRAGHIALESAMRRRAYPITMEDPTATLPW